MYLRIYGFTYGFMYSCSHGWMNQSLAFVMPLLHGQRLELIYVVGIGLGRVGALIDILEVSIVSRYNVCT